MNRVFNREEKEHVENEEKSFPWLLSLLPAHPQQLWTCPDAEHARHKEDGDM